MKDRKKLLEYLLLALVLTVMGLLVWSFHIQKYQYKRYETAFVHYLKGRVEAVLEEDAAVVGEAAEYSTGYQKLSVRLLEGQRKDELLELDNYITVQHHVVLKAGSRVVVCADEPENAEPYYTIYNYDRNYGIWVLATAFLLLVILVGRKQGFMSCIGLVFTIFMVVCYLLPRLYEGKNGLLAALMTVAASCMVTCFCIGGLTVKTGLNIISAVLGGLSAGLIYKSFMVVLHITGCNLDEAEALVLISQATGLKMGDVLVAGVMTSAIGAVMDVAVSMGAALGEIFCLDSAIGPGRLFRSGMNIGRDMIGTMTNTLILAFAGSALSTLIVLISYGVQYNQLMSSNFLTLEIAQGIAGSAAVVLTVPISAAVCAVGYGHSNRRK